MFEKVKLGFINNDLEVYSPTATLIYGDSGNYKTIFGIQTIYNGYTKYNEKGAYFQIINNPFEIEIYSYEFKWNIPKLQRENMIIISSFSTSDYILFEPTKYKTEVMMKILTIIKDFGIKRVVFDQIDYIKKYLGEESKYIQILTHTINLLKNSGCNVFMIQQNAGIEKLLFENIFKFENKKIKIEKAVGINFKKREYDLKITESGLDIE